MSTTSPPQPRVSEAPATPLHRVLGRRLDRDERAAALDRLRPAADERTAHVSRVLTLMVLSTLIAGMGLLDDSAAVVIGAMLVAPLMGPILALAAGLVRTRPGAIAEAGVTVVVSAVVAIATGWALSALIGDAMTLSGYADELRGRASAGLIDLFIASAAGAAGGFVLLRQDASDALPGAGIAVALVPPLAAVGLFWQLGEGDMAVGAFLLFATNLAAIVFTASLVLLALGARPASRRGGRDLALGLTASLGLVVAVTIPLSLHTDEVLRSRELAAAVRDAVPSWDPSVELLDLDVDLFDDPVRVELQVRSTGEVGDPAPLAEVGAATWGGTVAVNVVATLVSETSATSR